MKNCEKLSRMTKKELCIDKKFKQIYTILSLVRHSQANPYFKKRIRLNQQHITKILISLPSKKYKSKNVSKRKKQTNTLTLIKNYSGKNKSAKIT